MLIVDATWKLKSFNLLELPLIKIVEENGLRDEENRQTSSGNQR